MIQKYNLIKGAYYFGSCRNTQIAIWEGEQFIFINYFFGKPYIENIKYYGDVKDTLIDGFIPIKKIEIDVKKIISEKNNQDYKHYNRNLYNNTNEEILNGEIWKVIPNYENYSVSNLGRIKNNKTNLIKKQCFVREYLTVGLINKNKKNKCKRIHRLVLQTFNPSQNYKNLEVNHINGIKTDNRLKNLEWVSHKSNMKHLYSSGNFQKKLNPLYVKAIKEKLNQGVKQKEIAREFKVGQSIISEIKIGKKWTDV